MKRFKGLLFVLFAFIALISLTGCGNKTAITAEDFKTKMEGKGYSVTDATSQFSEVDYIEKAYVALSSDQSYQIEFYQISDNDKAAGFYNNNKQIFEESKGNTNVESSVSIGNHSKYTLETDGMYKIVSRIDNTVVYLNVESENKSDVQDILKELDY